MKQVTSTITTVFSNEMDGITYEYTATQQAGKAPSQVSFVVRRDTNTLVKGYDRNKGNFYFETLSDIAAPERSHINTQINADLEEVKVLAKGINITSE